MENILEERKALFFDAFFWYTFFKVGSGSVRENIQMFQEWYRLCKPNKAYWFFQFATVIVVSICLVCESMYVAKVTTSLAEGNFKMAIFCLTLGLIFVLLRQFSWILNYKNMYNLIGDIYKRLEMKIFHKIIHGKEKNFEVVSKEKLINIFHSDAYETAKFCDHVCTRFRYLLSTILTLCYVCTVSIPIALVIFAIIIINYKVLNWINSRISKATKETKEAIDAEFETFSEIVLSKHMIKSYDLTKKMEREFAKKNDNFMKKQQRKTMATSMLENNFFGYYKTVIYGITLVLIYLLSSGNLSLTVYLIVVSYLTDSITNSKDFMGILTELKNAYVTCNRVNIILNFDEQEALCFGNVHVDDIAGEIDFVNVSVDASNVTDFEVNDLKNASFHIGSNQTVLFHGARSSGKRTIFYLLRRLLEPEHGDIFIDKYKISDFHEKVFRKNINYLTTKPFFYHGSILSNLKLVHSNKEKIMECLKEVKLYDYIMNLPMNLKTEASSLPLREQYLLGLARLLLMDSEILVLYEFPNYLSVKDKLVIKNILMGLHGKKTIVVFSANEDIADIADQVYEVERGKVKLHVKRC